MFDTIEEDDVSVTVPRDYLVPSLLPSADDMNFDKVNSGGYTVYLYCCVETSIELFTPTAEIAKGGFLYSAHERIRCHKRWGLSVSIS